MWRDVAKLNSDRRGTRGFTILELLTVMLIITLLVAMVIGVVRYADRASQTSMAKADLERLHAAIGEYELEEGYVPETDMFYSDAFRSRTQPSLAIEDPWGANYAYTNLSDRGYQLFCLGPDGAGGTADDIHPGE